VLYAVSDVLKMMRKEGFPEALMRSVSQGISLDTMAQEKRGSDRAPINDQILRLAESSHYEKSHSQQVTKVALRLFDELEALHKLGPREKFLLESAAMLHDIGWIKGRAGHHKTARDMILASDLSLPDTEKMMTALTARYHRSALPQEGHKYYSNLNPAQKLIVRKLAALLRVADGLDRGHINSVEDLKCAVYPQQVTITVKGVSFSDQEKRTGEEKADLFEKVFRRKVLIRAGGR